MNESDKSFMWCELMHLWSNMWWDAPQDPEHVDPKYRYRNSAGAIGGVGSGGVVEMCLTFPLFHHSTLPPFHFPTRNATGGTPVVPVVGT